MDNNRNFLIRQKLINSFHLDSHTGKEFDINCSQSIDEIFALKLPLKLLIPFIRSHFKDDWDSFIKTYSKWQNGLLSNSKLKCTDLQAVVFKPTAGLGDSANALSAAFLYTIRAGMMFFIDWQPWDWETGFAGPGFQVSYSKMIKEKRLCER